MFEAVRAPGAFIFQDSADGAALVPPAGFEPTFQG